MKFGKAVLIFGLLFGVLTVHCAVNGDEEVDEGHVDDEHGEEDEEESEDGDKEEEEDENEEDAGGDEVELLTHDELKAVHAKFDLNKDGKASLAELQQFAKHMRRKLAIKDTQRYLADMDNAPMDGKLSLKELIKGESALIDGEQPQGEAEEAHVKDKFHAADADSDGVLSQDEIVSFFHPSSSDKVLTVLAKFWMESGFDKNKDGKIDLSELKSEYDEETAPEVLQKHDKDKDGLLDLEEVKNLESGRMAQEEGVAQILQAADTDKDGHVTVDELLIAEELLGTAAHEHLSQWSAHIEL